MRGGGASYIHNKLILPDQIDEWTSDHQSVERNILSIITHRTNFPISKRRIGQTAAAIHSLQRSVKTLNATTSRTTKHISEQGETLKLYEEENKRLVERIAELEREQNAYIEIADAAEADRDRLTSENENLKYHLSKRSESIPLISTNCVRFHSNWIERRVDDFKCDKVNIMRHEAGGNKVCNPAAFATQASGVESLASGLRGRRLGLSNDCRHKGWGQARKAETRS
jgi:hypothetical protein